jgi:hypothetical protein
MMSRIINAYVRHVQKKANQNADKVREIQLRTARTDEQVVRVLVYEQNMKRRSSIPQRVHPFSFRVTGGRLEEVPEDSTPDGVVHIDVPVMFGLARGKFDRLLDGGGTKPYDPFNPTIAYFIGLIEVDGDLAVLRNLELIQHEVVPRLADIFRLPGL